MVFLGIMHEENTGIKDRDRRSDLSRNAFCFICTNDDIFSQLLLRIFTNQLFLILSQYALYACSVLLSPNS